MRSRFLPTPKPGAVVIYPDYSQAETVWYARALRWLERRRRG